MYFFDRQLNEEDKRETNLDMNEDFDIDNPRQLFTKVHDQALQDGYINELTSVLKNLVVLPANAHTVWLNVAKIVKAATTSSHQQLLEKARENMVSSKVEEKDAVKEKSLSPRSLLPSNSVIGIKGNYFSENSNKLGKVKRKRNISSPSFMQLARKISSSASAVNIFNITPLNSQKQFFANIVPKIIQNADERSRAKTTYIR